MPTLVRGLLYYYYHYLHLITSLIIADEAIAKSLLPLVTSGLDSYMRRAQQLAQERILERINIEASVNPQMLGPGDRAYLDQVGCDFLYGGLPPILEDGRKPWPECLHDRRAFEIDGAEEEVIYISFC